MGNENYTNIVRNSEIVKPWFLKSEVSQAEKVFTKAGVPFKWKIVETSFYSYVFEYCSSLRMHK